MTTPVTIRWTPINSLPRQISFEPYNDVWRRIEQEWTGSDWRESHGELITTHPITNPTKPPTTLGELLAKIHNTWEQDDPLVLTFTSHTGVVAAVDDELRYRSPYRDHWFPLSKADLESHLRARGYPAIQPLSETPYDQAHFSENSTDSQ